ncbi:hypothetical protein WK03_06665 [Burkholderia cepacia]|nr:hypothetical protein WK03_06665 [Burkholderia cepacia]
MGAASIDCELLQLPSRTSFHALRFGNARTIGCGDTFVKVYTWLVTEADKTQLVCANRQYYLLRENAPTCWAPAQCEAFLAATLAYWDDWGA